MTILAHFQDGPAQGRVQVIKERSSALVVPVGIQSRVVSIDGVVNEPTYRGYHYTLIGGWLDKFGNEHNTYAPTELMDEQSSNIARPTGA